MATPKLDGAGAMKMQTLDDADVLLQKVHGIVEQMAMSIRASQPIGPQAQRLKRAASPLVGLLKGQFALISDAVAALVLLATRGGSDQMRVRALREGVGSLRMMLDVAKKKVIEEHTQKDESGP